MQVVRWRSCQPDNIKHQLFHETQPSLERAGERKRRGRKRRRTGHNLLLRLSTRKEDVLRFLTDPDVPFTNNQAEQDGRMMKVKQKISGGSGRRAAPIPSSLSAR